MSEEEIFSEIRLVFCKPMGNDESFPFELLQPTGGCSKSLTIPSRSSNFEWNASTVAGKNAKMTVRVKMTCPTTQPPVINLVDNEEQRCGPEQELQVIMCTAMIIPK